MRAAWRFIRRWWWVILGTLAAALGAALAIFVRPSDAEREQWEGRQRPQTFRQRAAQEVERVHLEGEVEKARVRAQTWQRNRELDEIEVIGENNPTEGRKQLAGWLAKNL